MRKYANFHVKLPNYGARHFAGELTTLFLESLISWDSQPLYPVFHNANRCPQVSE